MKALTLHQPWATCIAQHGKRVENRTWAPPQSMIGQRIAIHAGMKLDRGSYEMLVEEGVDLGPRADLPLGAVVATARVAGWVRTDGTFVCHHGHREPAFDFFGVTEEQARDALRSTWWIGPVGWMLSDVVEIKPVACKGAQGLWTLPADVERTVLGHERATQIVDVLAKIAGVSL